MILLNLFLTFFKIGAFTFGGGYAMIPLIQGEVQAKGWMTLSEIVNFIAVSESTPGPFAVNMATFIGTKMGGILGAFFATLGLVLPSFIIILIIAKFFMNFQNNIEVRGIMAGLKPAVIGMIGAAVVSIGQTVFFPKGFVVSIMGTYGFWCSVLIFILMLLLIKKKLHPILIIVLSAILGIVSGYGGLMFSI
ncbi:chromate transporter [Hathewaya proteolytica DSM 3090]|uniref:Chromate transporter n=1 Tax=Hathewaya proteolytica DSM 3090 TaxID=1121331 RepID=A0A1M6K4E1_9CLOT|nr:chromate transporter [Hathewaya proteolytica]SHJ53765.1 chromate transporter [Hathewaya proteolytica DSM 3090]